MDFKAATDVLFSRVSHEDLAQELGVSVPSIRQARLRGRAHAHRNPPEGWESAAKKLAERQIRQLRQLVAQLP
jgi:hypothetical protein